MLKRKPAFVILGWYQIVGGIGGLIMIMILLLSLNSTLLTITDILTIIGMMSSFFIFSIFCGILCLRLRTASMPFSLINQFLQLISFSVVGFAFNYVAGIYFTIGVDLTTSFDIYFGIGIPGFKFQIDSQSEETIVNVNLVALAIIFWIAKLQKEIKAEKH